MTTNSYQLEVSLLFKKDAYAGLYGNLIYYHVIKKKMLGKKKSRW